MEDLISYLRDSDCGAEQISQLCRLYENGETDVLAARLRCHRCALMEKLHESQRKVDCLDLLLRRLMRSEI